MSAKLLKNKFTVLAALLAGSVGTAQAVPYTWQDYVGVSDLEDVFHMPYVSAGNDYEYMHVLDGFTPGVDSISSASLSIWLTDDALLPIETQFDIGLTDPRETVGFSFDGSGWTSSYDVDFIERYDFTVTSLLSDGLLNVVVHATSGDFRFGASLLTANGDHGGSTSVPEPATLSLLGFGVLATGFAARRRRRKQ